MGQTHELMVLRSRVEAWRRAGGGRGSRIPEALWNDAVAVSREVGLYATARALRFNYEGLKKRVAKANGKEKARSAFVPLEIPGTDGGLKVVVDLVSRDGAQMRIDVTGAKAMDVLALAQTLWERRV